MALQDHGMRVVAPPERDLTPDELVLLRRVTLTPSRGCSAWARG